MRYQSMPYHTLKCFGMRRDILGVNGRDQATDVGDPRGVAAISSDNADNRATYFFRQGECLYKLSNKRNSQGQQRARRPSRTASPLVGLRRHLRRQNKANTRAS